jgi:hypothetical protein
MTEAEIKDHIRDCCDKCCEGYPKIAIDDFIEIYCPNCGLSAEWKDVYEAVKNWNKEVRGK